MPVCVTFVGRKINVVAIFLEVIEKLGHRVDLVVMTAMWELNYFFDGTLAERGVVANSYPARQKLFVVPEKTNVFLEPRGVTGTTRRRCRFLSADRSAGPFAVVSIRIRASLLGPAKRLVNIIKSEKSHRFRI